MRYGLGFWLALVCASPASAGQPFEESLVECGVLIALLTGQQTPVPGENSLMDYYVASSDAMLAEAERRAGADYVARMSDVKERSWEERWDAGDWDKAANRGELAEWWEYCFKFADHLDILPEGPSR